MSAQRDGRAVERCAAVACAPRARGRGAGRLVLALLAAACTQLSVTPEVAISRVPGQPLVGRLLYKGDPQYVPRTLRPREDAPGIFVFSVTEISSRGGVPLLGQLYPLTLLGLPTQQTTVTASATLEIRSARGPIAVYRATARARAFRSQYGSDRSAELTRSARLALRDNLDAQLINELPSLAQQLAR